MPVPESNGEEWDRLEPASALDVLVELALHGEYNGLYGDRRLKDALELRGAALSIFDVSPSVFVSVSFIQPFPRTLSAQKKSSKLSFKACYLQKVCLCSDRWGIFIPLTRVAAPTASPMISPLLHALCIPPTSPLNIMNVTTTHFATLLFAHLLASSPRCKALARSIKPTPAPPLNTPSQGQFFVPADGAPPPPTSAPEADDEDAPQSLIPLFTENLSLSFLSKSRVDTANEKEVAEWERLIVGYLCLLAQWLWEDPKAVGEFLEAGGLGVVSVHPDSFVLAFLCIVKARGTYQPNRGN